MPALVQKGSNFWLACQYELESGSSLYSVKWYKNNEEFYRLIVGSGSNLQLTGSSHTHLASSQLQQQQQYFTQAGVNVLVSIEIESKIAR